MKTATYFSEVTRPNPGLFVLAENANGTVDLGRNETDLLVGSCPVSDVPKHGHCVIDVEAPEPAKKKTKAAAAE